MFATDAAGAPVLIPVTDTPAPTGTPIDIVAEKTP
jgi:hypothetical protein